MSRTITDRFGRTIPQLRKQERLNLQQVLNLTRPGVPITHDLSDPVELEFVMRQHGGRTFLAKYYPAILHALEQGRQHAENMKRKGIDPRTQHVTLLQMDEPPVNQWLTTNAITAASFMALGSTTCHAEGVSSVMEGTFLTQLTMTLHDLGSGQIIAQETVPNIYDQGLYVTVGAQGDVASVGNPVMAVMTATYIPQGQVQPVSQTVTRAIQQICPISPPGVTGPVHNNNTKQGNPIKVALNRTAQQQPDCDYYYTTGMSGRTPNVGIQVSGSATFQQNVCPLNFGQSLQGQLLLFRRTDPAGAALALSDAQFAAGITANGTQLGWNWGANNIFGAAPWDQNQLVDLSLNIDVAVSSNCSTQTAPNARVTVTSAPNAVADNCTAKIDPLVFVWGCLAAESLVLMADGQRKPVLLVEPGECVVCDPDGTLALVSDKIIGFEDREPCLRISTADRSVIVTQDHPMLTPDGAIRAAELRIGEHLCTFHGVESITAIQTIRYENAVVNLKLEPLAGKQRAIAAGLDGMTHSANDFLVGDSEMQRAVMQRHARRRTDEATVLRNLPGAYHLDYINLQRARRGEPLIASK